MMVAALFALAAAVPTPRDTAERLYQAFNKHDVTAMAALYHDDARLISPDFCAPRGRADVERTYQTLFAAFPDLHDDVEEMLVDGDHVVVRFTSRATLDGRPFMIAIANFLTFRDGRIVEDRDIFDVGGRPCTP
jgi:ketosteroid isomerase-like protein